MTNTDEVARMYDDLAIEVDRVRGAMDEIGLREVSVSFELENASGLNPVLVADIAFAAEQDRIEIRSAHPREFLAKLAERFYQP